jgi:hypothetical protein
MATAREQRIGPRQITPVERREAQHGEGLHQLGVGGPAMTPAKFQRGAEQSVGPRVLAFGPRQVPRVVQGCRQLERVAGGGAPPQRHGVLQEPGGLTIVAQRLIDPADHAHHRRLHAWLTGQLPLDPAGARIQQLARRDLATLGLRGIDRLEEIGEEGRDLGRLLRLGSRPVAFPGEAHRIEAGEAGHQGHDGPGGREPGPVSADELAGAIAQRVGPRPDRAAVQVAGDVVRQLLHRSVPPGRLLPERHQHDGVEVAGQPPPQSVGRRAARRRHRRRRHGAPVAVLGPFGPEHRRTGPFGVGRGDGNFDRLRGAVGEPVGTVSTEQLAQHDAELVDVGGGGDGVTLDLFRAGVGRRHGSRGRAGHRRAGRRFQQLGDPEVEQLGHAVGRDQDVARLEVAVDHEIRVSELHGAAHLSEQSQARVDREPAPVTEQIQRLARHVLHDHIGQVVVAGAAVEQPSDVGVLEVGQDLPFHQEPPPDLGVVGASADQLDRDLLAVLIVGPDPQIDGPHPAPSQLAGHLVRPQPAPDVRSPFRHGLGRRTHGSRQERASPILGRQQRLRLLPQGRVAGTRRVQVRRPGLRRQARGRVHHVAKELPTVRTHGAQRSRPGGRR